MHFKYEAAYKKWMSCAKDAWRELFQNRNKPNRWTFERLHRELKTSDLICDFRHDFCTLIYYRIPAVAAQSEPLVFNSRRRRSNVRGFGLSCLGITPCMYPLLSLFIFLYIHIHEMHSESSYWCNDACCSKSVREMIVASEFLLYI